MNSQLTYENSSDRPNGDIIIIRHTINNLDSKYSISVQMIQ